MGNAAAEVGYESVRVPCREEGDARILQNYGNIMGGRRATTSIYPGQGYSNDLDALAS